MIGKQIDTTDLLQIQTEIDLFINANPHIKVLLKQGENGSSIHYKDSQGEITRVFKPAYSFEDYPSVSLIDTTGAGDCFTGAFAVQMLNGVNFEDALQNSNKVGFLCITKFGAGPSIPSIHDVNYLFSY